MGLPASLGKDRLSMSFHGRKEAQDGRAGDWSAWHKAPDGSSGRLFWASTRSAGCRDRGILCRDTASLPGNRSPAYSSGTGGTAGVCMVPHGKPSRRKSCFLSAH